MAQSLDSQCNALTALGALRGQRAGQHKLIEEVVQPVLVWVVHRRGEEKQLRLHCKASDQLKMIVFRSYQVIVREDIQCLTDWALC